MWYTSLEKSIGTRLKPNICGGVTWISTNHKQISFLRSAFLLGVFMNNDIIPKGVYKAKKE